ncbi:MAG: rhomboid family intramembrane serine protease [Bacteroidia bacterium]
MKNEHKTLLRQLAVPAIILVGMWLVFGVEWLTGKSFSFLGILPRKLAGLPGIVLSPFIHGDLGHITSNSIPIFVLSAGLFIFYQKIAGQVLSILWLGTGIWVWIAARSSFHIGASGLVYALVFFLFFSGVFRKETQSMAIALIVALFYGSAVWGILPIQEGVSWESHLFGACVGTIVAFFFRKSGPQRKTYDWEEESEEEEPRDAIEPWNYRTLFPPPDGFTYPPK